MYEIQTIWSPDKSKTSHIKLVDQTTGDEVMDEAIPDYFNSHLSKVGGKLAEKFRNDASFVNVIQNTVENFKFLPINEAETSVEINQTSEGFQIISGG